MKDTDKTSTIAIIPARGGSKRIPRKNIKPFLGKPVIAYTIEAALGSGLFDEIMVSTDDQEIADIAVKLGVKVPFMRSVRASDDHATTADVLVEVLQTYEERYDRQFIWGCCIYPASPLIRKEHLINGFKLLKEGDMDSVFPVTAFSYPVWRGLRRNKDGMTEMIWPEYRNTRSQDLEAVYHDAGQWYWFNIESFKAFPSLYSKRSATIVLDEMEIQDIDSPGDWKLAEMKYNLLNEKQ